MSTGSGQFQVREILVTDPGAGPSRPTDDVDVIIDVASRVELYQLNAQLRDRGFCEAMQEDDAPVCRWIVDGQRVDIMPIDPAMLGFSNVWYSTGLRDAVELSTEDSKVRVIDGPHFCATKLEAFAARSEGDYYHHDMEDFIAIVDGRPTLLAEITVAPKELREFLTDVVSKLLNTPAFIESLPGQLPGDAASQARLPLILQRLRTIAAGPGTKPPTTGATPPKLSRGLQMLPARTLIRSSNLLAAQYDAATQALTIEFRNGTAYKYAGVPPTIYAGLLTAASAGRYHHQWIKRYSYARLR